LLQILPRPSTKVTFRLWARREFDTIPLTGFSNDVVLLQEQWGIRKQRGKPDVMMKAERIRMRHGKESEASRFWDFWFGAEFSSKVAVDSSRSA
jgi:hypothetical protein